MPSIVSQHLVASVLSLLAMTSACTRNDNVTAQVQKTMQGIQPGEERELGAGVFMRLNRVQVAAPLPDGWHLASSPEGAFTVEVPIPFNDARMRAMTEDNVELRTHVIGAKTPGLLSWAASCFARRDGRLGKVARRPNPEKIEIIGTPPKAHQRTVEFEDMVCTLIVEAQGSEPLPPEAERIRFLASLKRAGKPSW